MRLLTLGAIAFSFHRRKATDRKASELCTSNRGDNHSSQRFNPNYPRVQYSLDTLGVLPNPPSVSVVHTQRRTNPLPCKPCAAWFTGHTNRHKLAQSSKPERKIDPSMGSVFRYRFFPRHGPRRHSARLCSMLGRHWRV